MLETSEELCSARLRTVEPNATFGCTEATTPAWPCFHVHSINASVGPSPDEATTATWRYQRNQQYSITAVTTSSGSVAERYAYTAYGQPTILDASGSVLSSSAINNRYTYTGREWDQTLGLYHFRARWMSGLAGRFLTRDPIGFEGSEWGLYEFVDSQPLLKTDPSGKIPPIVIVPIIIIPILSGCSPKKCEPLTCDEVCARLLNDKPNLGKRGGTVACYDGQKCPCVFGVPGIAPGDCPEIDKDIREHEEKHIPEVICQGSKCNVSQAVFPTQGDQIKKECPHRRDSRENLIAAYPNATPSCKDKIKFMVKLMENFLSANCHEFPFTPFDPQP